MSNSSKSLREQVIGFLVWTAVASSILAPILFFGSLQFRISRALTAAPLPGSYEDTVNKLNSVGGADSGGQTQDGQTAEARARQIARIKTYVGTPEQAAGWAKHVQFLSISFSLPELGAKDNGKSADGYRELTFSFDQRVDGPNDDAYVIFADQAIRWTIKADGLQSRPRIGFEGPNAFDVAEAPSNVLAGYRIGAFGGGEAARPNQGSRPKDIDSTFCASLASWTRHFGVRPEDIRVFSLTDPKRIWSSGAEWNSDARDVSSSPRQAVLTRCGK